MKTPLFRCALITGASSGLGAEYARQLARQGSNLILVARRLERLEALKRELELQHNIQAEVLEADLVTDEGVSLIERRLQNLPDLDLLVNNAGYGLGGQFSTDPVQKQLELIHVQVIASVRLARAALDGMRQRNRGAIINVASVAAFFPLWNVTYSSVKAYLVNFSEALQSELWSNAVKVQALCAGFVITEFHDTPELEGFQRSAIPAILWLKAEYVVKESLKALRRSQVVVIPSWQYQFISTFARIPLTANIVRFVARQILLRMKKD
jgi:short-subunit dehydrogenase